MKSRVAIIGAGLGGCVAADALASTHDVSVVELGADVEDMQARIKDVATPARLYPHVGAGLGGSTALWHNGLIEIDERVFTERWPFPKSELAPWYERAYSILAGVEREKIELAGAQVRAKYEKAGACAEGSALLFCPIARRNLWETCELDKRVRLITGEVTRLEIQGDRIQRAVIQGKHGESHVDADIFILAAGGLGTPGILQELAQRAPQKALRNAGRFYEDHPMTFVALAELRAPLYRFWNFSVRGTGGNLRVPLIVWEDGLQVSFQIRPAALFLGDGIRQRMSSVITQLRNAPFNPMNYLRLLRRRDDLLDILSFRFGIRIPTRHYSLLMVAEQPPSATCAVARDLSTGVVTRNWELSPEYLATLSRAINKFISGLGDIVRSSQILPNWQETLATAAHHSGTARMSRTAETGVCDANARVHGIANLYVSDGSIIPGSGISNTGLTIAALALRLADHLKQAASG